MVRLRSNHANTNTSYSDGMREGPSIAGIAALIGDPARANMLTALTQGAALTATELALEANVTKQTASSHLAKLVGANIVSVEAQGRHRYYRLADEDVAHALESLTGVAARAKALRFQPGPKDPALRRARVCYDHLAGEMGVALFDALVREKTLARSGDGITLTKKGRGRLDDFGLDVASLEHGARPLCRACLDWSVRRTHLAGAVGAALLAGFYDRGWAKRQRGTRVVEFSRTGEASLRKTFHLS